MKYKSKTKLYKMERILTYLAIVLIILGSIAKGVEKEQEKIDKIEQQKQQNDTIKK